MANKKIQRSQPVLFTSAFLILLGRHCRSLARSLSGVLLGLIFLTVGCASDPNTPYSYNSFYTGDAQAPRHPPRAHTDFFDKVCTPSGSSDGSAGRSYTCHYED